MLVLAPALALEWAPLAFAWATQSKAITMQRAAELVIMIIITVLNLARRGSNLALGPK